MTLQQGAELFAPGEVKGHAEPMGPRGALPQRGEPPGVEGCDGIPNRLGITSQLPSNLGGLLPPSTGQQDLGPAVDEGVRRAQARHQWGALGVLQRTHIHRVSHTT